LLGIAAVVLVRQSLVAAGAGLATYYAINNSPLTLNYTAWYAPTSFVMQAALVLALVACWRMSVRASGVSRVLAV